MINHWQHLLAVDQYRVTTKGMLAEYDRKIIAMLYQPLIGPLSVSLYITLWSELERNRLWSQGSNHYRLMETMSLSLPEIYQARSNLEGIGLLKVYKKTNDQKETAFLYELMSPLSPEQFFSDGMLSIYLYKKIGKDSFNKLKILFSDESWDMSEFEETTKSFPEVFDSLQKESLYVSNEFQANVQPVQGQSFVGQISSAPIEGFEERFDFDLFFGGIGKALIPDKVFTKEIQKTIAKLAFIYGINPLAMQKVVMDAFDLDLQELTVEGLRKAAQEWYQFEYNEQLPSLAVRVQPLEERSDITNLNPQEQERIRHLESVSPRELLREYGKGAEPTSSELKIVEEVMFEQKLSPGIMNVLIDFVLLKNDMRFPGNFVKAIASHWRKKDLKTVKEAMDFARSELEKEKKRAKQEKSTYTKKKQPVRTEVVPDWLKEQKKQEAVTEESKADADFAAQRAALQAKLKKKYNTKG
ncbi:MAG: replication initiation and membrane attachment family protein [Bacillus sp. (in: firmicutes)]